MASTTNSSTPSNNNQIVVTGDTSAAAEESAAKSVQKRYEGLAMVRTKAVKGKGAWYWAHLEPILVRSPETGLPKAVKLRCSLCNAVFSASNPSRTASEHLKRGTCPNFSCAVSPKPISTVSPGAAASAPHLTTRKRAALISPPPPPLPPPPVVLSGGKEDLGALAMLEDRVKKLKSPKASPAPALSRSQVESAVELLSDWVYDSYGSVLLSSLDHPKFRAFLNHVGVPPISLRDLAGARLECKFEESRAESEARIRDAMFFQLASEGWQNRGEDSLVNLTVNLPNGTSLYRRAVILTGRVPAKYAEEVLWETVTGITGSNVAHQCAGIVADRFKSKALRSLELQNHWMVNLSCQFHGFKALIKDFFKELPLFNLVRDNCAKLVAFVNSNSNLRSNFHKFQLQEYSSASLIRLPASSESFEPVLAMLEDVLSSARAVQLVLIDDSFKAAAVEDPNSAREVSEIAGEPGFWSRIEAVHSLARLIKDSACEVEAERPLVGQCLPLWEQLKAKIKDWCGKYRVNESTVDRIVDRRFRKNYHPAWAAAFILDPFYLTRDASGKYLPPFKCLTAEQEKDVDKLITRLVSRDEAHIVLMELMKWRTEGLDPVYARAVQMKERDPVTGKMRIANPQSGRLVWETYLTEFKSLGRVAVRLIFLHATACAGFKCNWSSVMRSVAAAQGNSRAAVEKAQKLVFVAAHSRLERRDFAGDEEKDAQLLALANEEEEEQALDKHIVAMARPP